jgi:hypothetical protein
MFVPPCVVSLSRTRFYEILHAPVGPCQLQRRIALRHTRRRRAKHSQLQWKNEITIGPQPARWEKIAARN